MASLTYYTTAKSADTPFSASKYSLLSPDVLAVYTALQFALFIVREANVKVSPAYYE